MQVVRTIRLPAEAGELRFIALIVLLFAASADASADASEVKLVWTYPRFNSTGVCGDTIPEADSSQVLTDLYRAELFAIRVPENDTLSLGYIPAAGKEGQTDSCLVELADSIHYVVFYLITEDWSANRSCPGNNELVVIPARDWQPGLTSTYFDNEDLTAQFEKKIDVMIAFRWGYSAPLPGMGADLFSERWEGQINFPVSGIWGLSAIVEDGWRAWVNGVFVANDFAVQAVHESSCQFEATAGWTPIVIEAHHHNGNAEMTLYWTPPGWPKVVVPAENWRH